MEASLCERELLQVGTCTNTGTMRLLPLGRKAKQKLVVGDDTGSVTCVQVRKGTPESVFKTDPTGAAITSLTLGGTASTSDKIYVAAGQRVRGWSKKGKNFVSIDGSSSETITNIHVEDATLYATGSFVFNKLVEEREAAFYMAHDQINALAVDRVTRDSESDAMLGCRDRVMRVVQESTCVFEAAVSGPINTLLPFSSSGQPKLQGEPRELVYGTDYGELGLLSLTPETVERGWALRDRGGPVNCVCSFDLLKEGVPQLLVGRDDGVVQVVAPADLATAEPAVRFERAVDESVRSICGGVVGTAGYEDVVIATFSGKVASFTTEPLHNRDEDDSYGRNLDTTQREARILKLRDEVRKLGEKVSKEREKLAKYSAEYVPTTQQFTVNSKFHLDADEAAYRITIEIPMPIDLICLQSNVQLDVLDVDSNEAVVSRSPPEAAAALDPNCRLLATYRSQESVNRMEMRVRTIEGEYGDLQVIVIANMSPKTAQVARLSVKPLSLHNRVLALDRGDRPLNELRFSGSFSLVQMHDWVSQCLPDVPGRGDDEQMELSFQNVYLGSVMHCTYSRGEALFLSDSVSTIAILKEVITKEATARNVRINMTFNVDEQTVPNFLRLVQPRLERQLALARRVELIAAVEEVKMQEPNAAAWMAPEYREILDNAEQLKADFKLRPRALEYLFGVVSDLFVDMHRFRGRDVKHMLPQLNERLQRHDFEEVVAFFQSA